MSTLGYIQKRTRIPNRLLNPRHADIHGASRQVVGAFHAPNGLVYRF